MASNVAGIEFTGRSDGQAGMVASRAGTQRVTGGGLDGHRDLLLIPADQRAGVEDRPPARCVARARPEAPRGCSTLGQICIIAMNRPGAISSSRFGGPSPGVGCEAAHTRVGSARDAFVSVPGYSVPNVGLRQLIPAGLADIPPGPELARVLAGIEPSRLSGHDCVEVLKAHYRQVNHERARLMAALVEVGLCRGDPDAPLARMPVPDEFSADEIRAALVLTRRAADAHLNLAYDLVTRLPAVHAAMDSGVLDEPRARVFSWTVELSDAQAQLLCAQLLPQAPELTTGQLIEHIKKFAIALDPDWARRRYERAIADRKVVGYRNPDGSANLSGLNLPVDRVAAACAYIDALAKAAKRAGDARPIDHIRADLFLGMTDGTYTGLDDTEIITRLLATAPHNATAPHDQPAHPAASVGKGGLELRVRLSTLLGLDEYPAELAGWGWVHAGLARTLTGTLGSAQWRFAVTDEHGYLLHCGITTVRPPGTPIRRASCAGVVELQIPATTLRDLARCPTAFGAWAGVVTTDLARRIDGSAQCGGNSAGTDGHNRTGNRRRAPGAALCRYLEARDRCCVMPGCRTPASGTDKDHTRDHGRGGPQGPGIVDLPFM
jgi:hypothetical protein